MATIAFIIKTLFHIFIDFHKLLYCKNVCSDQSCQSSLITSIFNFKFFKVSQIWFKTLKTKVANCWIQTGLHPFHSYILCLFFILLLQRTAFSTKYQEKTVVPLVVATNRMKLRLNYL